MIAVAACLVFLLAPRETSLVKSESLPATSSAARSTPSAGSRSLAERPSVTLPNVAAPLAPAARRVLENAVRTFELAELEKRRATNVLAVQAIEGFRRKMFLDDYNYAALIAGADSSRASTVYSNLLAAVSRLSQADLEGHNAGPPKPMDFTGSMSEDDSGKLRDFYSLALNSQNPEYRQVLEALQPISLEDPTATDLLKDAMTYVSARTEFAAEAAGEEEEIKKTREWIVDRNAQRENSAEMTAEALQRYEETRRRPDEEAKARDAAIRRLFADRFSHHHGLDAEVVFESLDRLSITNAAHEIWIPNRPNP